MYCTIYHDINRNVTTLTYKYIHTCIIDTHAHALATCILSSRVEHADLHSPSDEQEHTQHTYTHNRHTHTHNTQTHTTYIHTHTHTLKTSNHY